MAKEDGTVKLGFINTEVLAAFQTTMIGFEDLNLKEGLHSAPFDEIAAVVMAQHEDQGFQTVSTHPHHTLIEKIEQAILYMRESDGHAFDEALARHGVTAALDAFREEIHLADDLAAAVSRFSIHYPMQGRARAEWDQIEIEAWKVRAEIIKSWKDGYQQRQAALQPVESREPVEQPQTLFEELWNLKFHENDKVKATAHNLIVPLAMQQHNGWKVIQTPSPYPELLSLNVPLSDSKIGVINFAFIVDGLGRMPNRDPNTNQLYTETQRRALWAQQGLNRITIPNMLNLEKPDVAQRFIETRQIFRAEGKGENYLFDLLGRVQAEIDKGFSPPPERAHYAPAWDEMTIETPALPNNRIHEASLAL